MAAQPPSPRRSKSPVERLRHEVRQQWDTQLNPLQRAEIDEAFRLILEDEDNDTVDEGVLRSVLRALGHDESLLSQLCAAAEGGDGHIPLEDFCLAMSQHDQARMTTSATQLEEAFMTFDKDGNQEVDAKELNHVLKNLGFDLSDEEADEMLHLADTIHVNNVLTYDEFVKTLKRYKDEDVAMQVKSRKRHVKVACFVCGYLADWWPFWKTLGDPIDFIEVPVAIMATLLSPTILGRLSAEQIPFVAPLSKLLDASQRVETLELHGGAGLSNEDLAALHVAWRRRFLQQLEVISTDYRDLCQAVSRLLFWRVGLADDERLVGSWLNVCPSACPCSCPTFDGRWVWASSCCGSATMLQP